MSFSVEFFLLFLSVLFLFSLLSTKAGSKFGVPVLLLFLGIGMLFGTDGLGFEFQNYHAAQIIGTVALCIILFSGGLDTKIQDIKPVIGQGVILATVGVLLMAIITGTFIYYITQYFFPDIHLSFLESLLLASVMSSTDSASVFSILRGKGVRLKKNIRPLLELESGSNDPMAYLLTIILIQLIASTGAGNQEYGKAVVTFFMQFCIGGLAGFCLGKLAVFVINKINLDNESLYPILLFTCGIFIFSATYFFKGNGYLAVYIGGLVIGNARIVHKRSSLNFFDGLAWISQMIMFLTLGLLVNPKDLWPVALVSIIIGIFMIIGGRPLSVLISLLPFLKMKFREKCFVSWVGLRGAVPIIFAILPLAAGLENAQLMFNIVFFITLLSLLIQGTTLTQVAKWLRLTKIGENQGPLQDFDIEFSEDIKSTMTEIALNKNILSHGNRLMDIPLPNHTLAVMVKRDHRYFIPKGNTELHPGDKLLVITNDENALIETYKNLGIKNYRLRRN
ncbi:MAG: potassium/proton antiporter [Dysgonamonadaceae bacterium]|jgi:cell volume regulation protein A|nr:potassium/proton antiporter [Dysgonamonadaceae bacterium]